MFGPIVAMVKKEFIEIRRGRLLPLLVISPLIQVIIFGFVATTDIKHVKTLVCDEDGTTESRALAERFRHTEYFDVVAFTRQPAAIDGALARSRVKMAVRIPRHFGRDIARGKKTPVQLIVDGTDSNTASIASGWASLMINNYSQSAFAARFDRLKALAGPLPAVAMEQRVWYNPELKSAYSMVPGVVGLILMLVTLVVTSVSLVREKESGNIEQIIVTPITSRQIIAGKITPYIIISFLDIVLITLMSMLVFGIGVRGSFTLLMALSIFMIFANLGTGILISTVSETQQQAMLSDIFFFLPNMLLSGFIFPIKNMPEFLQYITYLVPLRYYIVIIRGIFLKGLTFTELLPQTAALFLFSAAIFALAILRFRKKLS